MATDPTRFGATEKCRERNEASSVPLDGQRIHPPAPALIEAEFDEIAMEVGRQRALGRRVVVVQGLGFVGAAVAAVIAGARDRSGNPLFVVIGVDLHTSYWKAASISQGHPPIVSPDPQLAEITYRAVHEWRNLFATVSERAYSLADVIVVDVPLDVLDRTETRSNRIEINLNGFTSALRVVGREMQPEALVIIETTVPVGTCESIALPILTEERRRRGIHQKVHLAHCYERVMPGPRYVDSIRKLWRTLSAVDQVSLEKAREFLQCFISTDDYPIYELADTASSEMAKLLENSYRAANIAFIHEWTLMAEQLGINLFQVIESIRVRKGTHDNIRFPGFGVGGYCLTKDSLLAQWSSNAYCHTPTKLDMTLKALEINYRMPLHTLDLLMELAGGSLRGKAIAVLGVSYLPGVADTRNSPTELLVDRLLGAEAIPMLHDPYVLKWSEKPDMKVLQDLSQAMKNSEGVVLAVRHEEYLQMTAEEMLGRLGGPAFIVDAQDAITDDTAKKLHDAGCRLSGVGKGHWRRWGYQWATQ